MTDNIYINYLEQNGNSAITGFKCKQGEKIQVKMIFTVKNANGEKLKFTIFRTGGGDLLESPVFTAVNGTWVYQFAEWTVDYPIGEYWIVGAIVNPTAEYYTEYSGISYQHLVVEGAVTPPPPPPPNTTPKTKSFSIYSQYKLSTWLFGSFGGKVVRDINLTMPEGSTILSVKANISSDFQPAGIAIASSVFYIDGTEIGRLEWLTIGGGPQAKNIDVTSACGEGVHTFGIEFNCAAAASTLNSFSINITYEGGAGEPDIIKQPPDGGGGSDIPEIDLNSILTMLPMFLMLMLVLALVGGVTSIIPRRS